MRFKYSVFSGSLFIISQEMHCFLSAISIEELTALNKTLHERIFLYFIIIILI